MLEALALCMREEYQGTYSDPRVCDVGALTDMMREGRLITCAALREDGEPVAVINLKECPPMEGIGDLSMHVVRRPFRGYGVGTPLVQYIMQLPESRRLLGVVSHSATYHAIAQYESYRAGLRPCGALYSVHINELLTHSFEKVGVKQSFLVAACPQEKRDVGAIYVPEEHRGFVEDCYRRMDTACTLAEAALPPPARTLACAWQGGAHQTMTVRIDACGADLQGEMERWLVRARTGGPLQTVTCFLNCSSPSAPAGYRVLRALGFRFAGLHPFSRGGEYLLLHHPMEVAVEFEGMKVAAEYQAVFDYLRLHYYDKR